MVVFNHGSAVAAPSNDGYVYGSYVNAGAEIQYGFSIKGDVFYGTNKDYLHVQKIFGIKVKMN